MVGEKFWVATMGPSILSHEPEDFGTGRSVLTTISSLFVGSTATNTDESLCVAVSAPRGRSLEIVQISAQFVPENDHEVHDVSIHIIMTRVPG